MRVLSWRVARIHISEAEAARDFASLMARVRAGAEVVIEDGVLPVALISRAVPMSSAISDCIALARRHEAETGEAPVLDAGFASDVEEIIRNRKPWNPPSWD